MGMIGNSLAQGLISGANIQDGTVDTPDIKDSAVTAAKIASAVVTPAKMDFSAGTANGVLYLNGSKVASSGSALVFDGTNFGIGAASPGAKLEVGGATASGKQAIFATAPSNPNFRLEALNGDTGTTSGTLQAKFGLRYDDGSTITDTAVLRFYRGAGAADGSIGFVTNNTLRATLDASGRLLVGPTSSVNNAKIETNGSLIVTGQTINSFAYDQAGIDFNASTKEGRFYATSSNGTGGFMAFYTGQAGGTEKARIDASGNLLLGSTSTRASAKLDIRNDNSIALGGNATYFGTIGYSAGTGFLSLASESGGGIAFKSGTTERARINSSGSLLVGTTSEMGGGGSDGVNGWGVQGAGNPNTYMVIQNRTDANMYLAKNSGYSSGIYAYFYVNGSAVGSISTNGSTTSYNTSSDYRLKEDIQPMVGALQRIAALKPVTYKWKADGSDGEGFIAHELADVVPDAVTGEKDAVKEDGSILPQGIDSSFLVATLTAAIKEQQAIIESLTERITALEAN